MKTVYLGLGSNVGDREQAIRSAIARLQSRDLKVVRVSAVYETAPQDVPGQAWFLNVVVEAETSLLPVRLLTRIASIEREMGRKRAVSKGPRNIDIDILLHGNAVVKTLRLQIPHPRMHMRRFVLEPMAELAPHLRHPESLLTMRELLSGTLDQIVRKVGVRLDVPDPVA